MQYKVKLSGVSKQYTLYRTNTEKLLDIITPKSMKKNTQRNFYALKDISLEINDGETIGVVGINGSGKSTLSNILSNVIPPTTGELKINGEPSLIAINVGLNNNLSGYDNIELKLLMHGFSRSQINDLIPSIKEFADIGDFMDQPVKKYSSGMKSRLGFAISVHTDPDLLIVDEALSVGDKTFYQKCLDKITEFKDQGKTIIFISHSIGQIKSISNRVLWLHNGELKEFGETEPVLENYEEYINWFNKLSNEEKQKHKEELKEKRATSNQPNNDEETNQYLERKAYGPNTLPSRYQKKSKKKRNVSKSAKNVLFPIQLSVILVAFLISAFVLIYPSIIISSSNEDDIATQEPHEEVQANFTLYEQVKEGIIAKDQVEGFEDEALLITKSIFNFGDNISVLGQNEQTGVYKVIANDQELYLEEDSLIIFEEPITETNLEEINTVFPERFKDAYLYFLSFLGEPKEIAKSSLRVEDENEEFGDYGKSTLSFPYEDFVIHYDENNIAQSIIVHEIDISIIRNATSSSIVLYTTGNLNIVFNLDDQLAIILKD